MAHYLVTAKPIEDKLAALRALLDERAIVPMRPFGNTLHDSLSRARLDAEGRAVWEEEDYCSPPLAMERAAVLDRFFTDLRVERVRPDEGWSRLEGLPSLWAPAEELETRLV